MKVPENGSEVKQAKKPAKGKERLMAALCCLLSAFLFFIAGWFVHFLTLGKEARALLWAVETAERNYYGGVEKSDLYADFFDDFALDPYSEYYTKEEYEAVLARDRGEEEGFGLTLISSSDGIRFYRVAGNSPAEKAGLRAGMYLYAYGEDEAHLEAGSQEDFLAFAKGKPSLTLSCGFSKDGSDGAAYTVKREAYALSECLYRDGERALRYVGGALEPFPEGGISGLPEDAAYLRLDAFHAQAAAETEALLGYFRAQGKRDLILDLRGNGGGQMSVLQDIAAFFMREAEDKRPVAAVARYRDGKETEFRATGNCFSDYFSSDSEIYVLADANTASASECLLGVLVSYKTLPYSHIFLQKTEGEGRTYGKGIMQTHYTDPAGNVLKLTSAGIFWPNGTSIHGTGVREGDGAIGISAPALPSAEDEMLARVLQAISAEAV